MSGKLPLWNHQQEAIDFVLKRPVGSLLAMAPGTGKSRVGIDLIQQHEVQHTLIACPKSVIDVWPDEFKKHWDGDEEIGILSLIEGSVEVRTKLAIEFRKSMDRRNQPSVIIGNYDIMWREPFRSWALSEMWDVVIPDESHRIKAAGSKVSRFFDLLRNRTGYGLGMSGTPMAQSPLDLYGQARFLDPSVFGTRVDAFKGRYCFLGGFSGHEVIGWQNLDELHEKFYQLSYVATEDVLDLPEELHTYRTCELEPTAHRHYRELQKEFVTETAMGVLTVPNAAVKVLRLQQLTGGWITHTDPLVPDRPKKYERISRAKLDLCQDVLEDFEREEPIVIFCRFHPEIDALHDLCRRMKRRTAELSGRINELRAWQQGKRDVLLAQMQTGTEGVDFTRSHYTIYYSVGYELWRYQQSIKRTRRPGQKYRTNFIHLLVNKTIDRIVYRALQNREEVVQLVIREGP